MAAVARIDVLDDLLAALVLEIDVDVGRLAARFRDEALEQQVDLGRVHRRDVEAIADDGVRSRATPLAQDAERARIGDDVVNGQEVRGEFEIVDEGQLLFDGLADFIRETVGEVAGSAFPGQRCQMLLRGLAWRHRLIRVFVDEFIERETAGFDDLECPRQCRFVTLEQARHLGRRFQVPLGVGFEPEPGLSERRFFSNARHDVLQRTAVG